MTARFSLFACLSLAICAAAPDWRVSPEPNSEFRRYILNADRVVVASIGPGARVVADVAGIAAVRAIADAIKFTGEYVGVLTTTIIVDGEEAVGRVNCLCEGDYSFIFSRGSSEVIRLSVHHWEHMRTESIARRQSIGITEESAAAIKHLISARNADEAKRIRAIDEYRAKAANKAPEPTPTSVTPPAAQEPRRP